MPSKESGVKQNDEHIMRHKYGTGDGQRIASKS